MSGHSKWATIKRQKGANDAKRGQLFTKLGNTVAVAAKSGGDPTMNPTLALAIEKAKAANMPNANIERSIKRGTGELGGDQITEYTYEGYGPGGTAIIVEAASDNKNRISTEVKTAFSKHGGNLAETGAVAYQFDRRGVIRVKAGDDPETTLLEVLDAGAQDASEEGDEIIVYTEMKDLAAVRNKLKEGGIEVIEAELAYIPKNTVEVGDQSTAQKLVRLLEAIDDIDDVTNTYSNFEIAEGIEI